MNGLMMIGGMAGGAEGGPFGPSQPNHKDGGMVSAKQAAGIGSPFDEARVQYRQSGGDFKANLGGCSVHVA
ncbi:MAG: hypothetical protein ABWY27_00490, partial [Telluria sp.]